MQLRYRFPERVLSTICSPLSSDIGAMDSGSGRLFDIELTLP